MKAGRASILVKTLGICLVLSACAVFSYDLIVLGLIATWVINK